MSALAILWANLGLVVFTAISVGVIGYLLYAMANPTRF